MHWHPLHDTNQSFADQSFVLASHFSFFYIFSTCFKCTAPVLTSLIRVVVHRSAHGYTKCVENKGSAGVHIPKSMQQQVVNWFDLCGCFYAFRCFVFPCNYVWVLGVPPPPRAV